MIRRYFFIGLVTTSLCGFSPQTFDGIPEYMLEDFLKPVSLAQAQQDYDELLVDVQSLISHVEYERHVIPVVELLREWPLIIGKTFCEILLKHTEVARKVFAGKEDLLIQRNARYSVLMFGAISIADLVRKREVDMTQLQHDIMQGIQNIMLSIKMQTAALNENDEMEQWARNNTILFQNHFSYLENDEAEQKRLFKSIMTVVLADERLDKFFNELYKAVMNS